MKPGEGFELLDHNDVLQLVPRERPPASDELIARVMHRTIGDSRAAVLRRPDAERLHAWLTRWLAEGWDGVERRCGVRHREDGAEFECDQTPGHDQQMPGGRLSHEGPAISWRTGPGRPGRRAWTDDAGHLAGAARRKGTPA